MRANEQNAIDNKLKMTKKLFNSFIMKLSSLPSSHILQKFASIWLKRPILKYVATFRKLLDDLQCQLE